MKYLGLVLCFLLGLAISFQFLSRVEIKTVEVIKTVKVYDFTQEPEIIQTYLTLQNKVIVEKTDLDKQWAKGYSEGIKEGIRISYR